MNKDFTCSLTIKGAGIIKKSCTFNPKEFIQCNSSEEVKKILFEKIKQYIDYGNFNLTDINNYNLDIPEEFFESWNIIKCKNNGK